MRFDLEQRFHTNLNNSGSFTDGMSAECCPEETGDFSDSSGPQAACEAGVLDLLFRGGCPMGRLGAWSRPGR
jgi:hypothetical protein